MQSLWHVAAGLAVSGMCLPNSLALGNDAHKASTPGSSLAPSAARIQDVALQPGGLLVGQVLDTKMQPMRGAAVVVQVEGQTAATTATDGRGLFAVSGLHGGVHQVVVGDATENCRLWVAGTAPPSAMPQLRIVPGQAEVVRGQWGPPPSYNTMMGWATNPWVIGGVVAAAIAVPIVLHNVDDDDEEGS
jgi:hypothetical protein